jgi:hypothetical protein
VKDANGDPAGEVAVSDVFNVVRDVVGVRKIGDGAESFLGGPLEAAPPALPNAPRGIAGRRMTAWRETCVAGSHMCAGRVSC